MGTHLFGKAARGAVVPPPRVALAARDAVIAIGARQASERLSLCEATVARIAGRLPCHRASIELAARRLGIDLESDFTNLRPILHGQGGTTTG